MVRLARLMLAFVLLLFAVSVTSGADAKKDKTGWIRVETEHFTLLGDAGARRTTQIGRKLEQLREVLARTSKGMELRSPLTTTIYVFKNDKSFAPFNLDEDGEFANVDGYFLRTPNGNYVAVNAGAETVPYGVIFHEYLHYVLENSVPAVPLWLNEGIAEFYSSFQVQGGRAQIGRAIPEHLFWLSTHSWMSLDALFAIDTDSTDYSEGDRQGTFYAQSWLLAHHLLVDARRSEHVGAFLSALGSGTPSAAAFEAAFGIDLLTAEKQLREYYRQGADGFYTYTPEEAFDDHPVEVTPLARTEMLVRLGDLLALQPPIQHASAERHLRDALEIDPTLVDASAALAFLRLAQERPEEAREFCVQALARDPDHGRALVLHGLSLAQMYFSTVPEDMTEGPDETPPLLLEARAQFHKRLQQAPDDLQALAGLGTTYIVDRTGLEPGIDAMARTVQASPARTDILALLILYTARSGNLEGAQSLLDRALRPRGQAEETRMAETEIVNLRLAQAQELIMAGEYEDARHLLQQMIDSTSDSKIRQALVAQLGKLTTGMQAEELRRQAIAAGEAGDTARAQALLEQVAATVGHGDDGSTVDAYNAAVALINAGEHEEGANRLERIAETTSRPDLKLEAANLAASVRQTIRQNRCVELYNLAVVAINGDDLAGAEASLGEVLTLDPPQDLRTQAEKLLREVRRRKR